jgi:two-component system phosphate regulon sensor histidine kinase PhoR
LAKPFLTVVKAVGRQSLDTEIIALPWWRTRGATARIWALMVRSGALCGEYEIVTIDDIATNTCDNRRDAPLLRIVDFYTVLLAMAAHDLRQPMQVIMNSYSALSRHDIAAPARKYIERGELAATQLGKHLDTLVEAIRLHRRAPGVGLAPVALQPFLDALCHDHQELARLKGVVLLCVPTHANVMSDHVLLGGIVRNLIRNALKYTAPGGRVLLGCRRRGPSICIEVHDTGVGIAPVQAVRIFDAFQKFDATQGNGTTTKGIESDGLGLGLFIVRQAAELLGHRVGVQSTVGRGSCFSIVARLAPPTAVAIARPSTPAPLSYKPETSYVHPRSS